jgi:excisionase family DNA binding protein
MSSNIKIQLSCEHCAQEFIARTTVTRFCSDNCAKRNYKKRIKENKIKNALIREHEKKQFDPNISLKEFISIKEAELLLGASRWTIYKLIESKKIVAAKLGSRTIIQKQSINDLFMLSKS